MVTSDEGNFIVHVVKAEGLVSKKNQPLNVSVILKVTGKGSWKSEVSTDRITTNNGTVQWDQSCEFNLQPDDTKLTIVVENYSKVDSSSSSEVLANMTFYLQELIGFEEPSWFPLKKKKNDIKERGKIMISFKFNRSLVSAVSMYSLNSFGIKESRMDKLKRKIHFGKKKSKDTQSLASFSLSRRGSYSSICSDALAFGSDSPVPPGVEDRSNYSISRNPSLTQLQSINNSKTLPPQQKNSIKESSFGSNNFLKKNIFSSKGKSKSNMTFEDVYEEKCNLQHQKSNHPDNTNIYNTISTDKGYPSQDINSLNSSSGVTSQADITLSKEEMLSIIQELQRECSLKDEKITALKGYMEGLLTKIINTNPEILHVNGSKN
ncbi:C2 domain and Rab-binding domain FIP-RBD-containing protein [Strongyloides ratti]|uniref:C2 domain and Rab-binding domain FIP-RBD-containing protein n=1 Tax=Strongyloides ratti TaxID=34506 RepID=A0A090KTV7_STRRB|nr:C2 domain and Rab-binding domain FIP-RBD-containing protein [Strongyloides ratti]CEF59280.1 C2 domain and Rab-binding domain FIP-RBD-containing protein [Strongyloides ratti]